MTPRNKCSEKQLKKKIGFKELRSTKIKLFPKKPRTYGGVLEHVKLIEHRL